MTTQVKMKEFNPIREMIEDQMADCEFSEKEAIELIIGERTGENFDIFDFVLGETEYFNGDWYQEISIIGIRNFWGNDELHAQVWTVTNIEAEIKENIPRTELHNIFNQKAVQKFLNDGKEIITQEIFNEMEFTKEELNKCAKAIIKEGYYSSTFEYTEESKKVNFDEEIEIEDLLCSVMDEIYEICFNEWEEMSDEEKEEEFENDFEYFSERFNEGLYFEGRCKSLIAMKFLNMEVEFC